jgi:hypothetical protein
MTKRYLAVFFFLQFMDLEFSSETNWRTAEQFEKQWPTSRFQTQSKHVAGTA